MTQAQWAIWNLENLPENRLLYKDSGVWHIYDDDMQVVLYEQQAHETIEMFLHRVFEKEHEIACQKQMYENIKNWIVKNYGEDALQTDWNPEDVIQAISDFIGTPLSW